MGGWGEWVGVGLRGGYVVHGLVSTVHAVLASELTGVGSGWVGGSGWVDGFGWIVGSVILVCLAGLVRLVGLVSIRLGSWWASWFCHDIAEPLPHNPPACRILKILAIHVSIYRYVSV